MAYNHFFNNRTFWLVGFDDARAQQIKETIVDNGGSVVFKLDSETTYCVATPSEMENVENILHGVHDLDVIIIKEEDIWKNGCRDTDRRGNNSGGSNSNSRNDQRTASETSTRSRNRSIPEYDGDDYFGQSHNRNRQSTNRHRSRSRTSGTVRTPSIIHSPLNGDDEHSGNLKRTNSDTHSFRTHRRHSSSAGTSGGLFGEQSDQHDNNNIEEDDDGQQNNFKSSTHSRLHRSRSDDDSNSNQSWQGDDEDEDEDGNANVSRLSIRMQDGDNEDDEDDGDGDEEEILEEEDEDDEDDDEDVLGNENEAIANHNNQDELIEDSKHQYQSKTTQNLNRSTTERNSNNSVSTDAIDQLSHSLKLLHFHHLIWAKKAVVLL
ncbi:hypothetical protein BDF19DRAFT_220417 [Syncephalis fuscata]|nr:hypothetical protein BDF19DRAFT_220417 [Syncephalis fuscata]